MNILASEIFIDEMEKLPPFLDQLASRFALITDSQVLALYGKKIEEWLNKRNIKVQTFSFPAGEQAKTRETKQKLEDELLAHQFDRESGIIALGGGVVTDLAGFVAATYLRGIPYISMPTTLLGMVDAGIGGKTGVNTPAGKNLIGALYPPQAVFIQPDMLSSLSEKEMQNGLAEVIKYGLIASETLFDLLENQEEFTQPVLFQLIYHSLAVKKKVVEADPTEKGLRRILNFGHTIGHAIETLENYQISHGAAVAIGMRIESALSLRLGHLKKGGFERIERILKKYRYPLYLPKLATPEKLVQAMARDKKASSGAPRFVLLKTIGEPLSFDGHYCTTIDEKLLYEILSHYTLRA